MVNLVDILGNTNTHECQETQNCKINLQLYYESRIGVTGGFEASKAFLLIVDSLNWSF